MDNVAEFFNNKISWLNRQGSTWKPFYKTIAFVLGGAMILILTIMYAILLTAIWVLRSAFQEPKGAIAGAVICSLVIFFLLKKNGYLSDIDPTKHLSNEDVTVVTGSLAGLHLGSLYGDYLHGGGLVPETLNVNFHNRLSMMWEKKLARFPKSRRVVREAGKEVVADYQHRTLVTLNQYRSHIDGISIELYNSINWEGVQKDRGLSKKEMNRVKAAMKKFRGNEMLSYALAEIMPTTRGDINVSMFDLLLQSAGREYLESIPAMGDNQTSFGLYQFTSYAVYDTPERKEAASRLNYCLPSDICIPGSVKLLRGDDHHRAAWLFALANICRLVRNDIDVSNWSSRELVGYIAMAHHAPANAIVWYTKGTGVARMATYRSRAWANYEALKKYRGELRTPRSSFFNPFL